MAGPQGGREHTGRGALNGPPYNACMTRHSRRAALALAPLLLWVGCGSAPEVPSGGPIAEWPEYGASPGGARFSPLTQINTENVGSFHQGWSYPLGRNQTTGDLGGGSQFTPVVIDGVMAIRGVAHWRSGIRATSARGASSWHIAAPACTHSTRQPAAPAPTSGPERTGRAT